MSLNNKKNALFGKSSSSPRGTSSGGNGTPSHQPKTTHIVVGSSSSPVNKNKKEFVASSGGLTVEAKAQKINEAKEASEKAMKSLHTSIFQWTPDYLSAGSYFDTSGNCYQAAGEYDLARKMFLQSTEASFSARVPSCAAVAFGKAATMAEYMGDKSLAAQHYVAGADAWGRCGDLNKMADWYMKAAKEYESFDLSKALQYQKLCCETYCPMNPSAPASELSFASPGVLDAYRYFLQLTYREYFQQHDKKKVKPILEIVTFLIPLFYAFENDSTAHKWILTRTILHLVSGDVVRAEEAHVQEHFSYPGYLHSQECEAADDLIVAFKEYDVDKLDECRRRPVIHYLDNDTRNLTRQLSLWASPKAKSNKSFTFENNVENTEISASSSKSSSKMPLREEEPIEEVTRTSDIDIEDLPDAGVSNIEPPSPVNIQEEEECEFDLA